MPQEDQLQVGGMEWGESERLAQELLGFVEPKTEADEATMEVLNVDTEKIKEGRLEGLFKKGKEIYGRVTGRKTKRFW